MKKHLFVPLAVATLVTCSAAGAPSMLKAKADEQLRYYYPDFATCEVTSEQIPCTEMIETETVTQYRMPQYRGS